MDHITYYSFNPLQNLKGFIISRPPVLVFLICLITFAVTALSLAYIVKTSELKNPDIELDWNSLLEKFGNINFCIHHNKTSEKPLAAFDSKFEKKINEKEVLSTSHSDVETNGNNSISVAVNFKFGPDLQYISPNITTVHGVLCGRFLGFKGVEASTDYHVNFDLPIKRKFTDCKDVNDCKMISQTVCITFYGLPHLPNTQKMKMCSPPELASLSINSTTFSVPQCPLDSSVESTESLSLCQGSVLHFVYTSNPNWSVMLSEHDKTLINFHLMYTSYFLLLMVMTLLCYAIIRGRPKNKIFLPEKVHLDS